MSLAPSLPKPRQHSVRSSAKRPSLRGDLQELWEEKYAFNRSKLKLSDQKAQEWADRTILAVQETEAIAS